jgi:hypothetical protein
MADYKWNIGAFQGDTTGSDYKWNIGADQDDGITVTYVDMEATVAMTLAVTGTLEVITYINMAGTIAISMSITGTLEANLVNTNNRIVLVALGHDELWYEDS